MSDLMYIKPNDPNFDDKMNFITEVGFLGQVKINLS